MTLTRYICGAFVALALSTATAAPPYKVYVPPTLEHVCVQVWLLSEPEVRRRCGGAIGCYIEGTPGLIIAPAPRDFNDAQHLWVLGHEFLHALGAFHD